MPDGNFMAFFLILRFWVETSRALSFACYVVAGPLVRDRENECVAKEIYVTIFGGAAPGNETGRRATPSKKGIFDCTMGFPGEDPA